MKWFWYHPKVKNGRGEQRADEESSASNNASDTRTLQQNRQRVSVTATGSPRALSCSETLIIKVFVYCLANDKPAAVRGGGTQALATLYNYAVTATFCLRHEYPLIFGRVHHRGTVLSPGAFRRRNLSAGIVRRQEAQRLDVSASRKIFRNVDQSQAKRGSRAAGYKRHGSLVVKLMRRCILSSLYLLPAEGFVAYSSTPIRPPKLRDESCHIFLTTKRFFSTQER